MQKMKKIKFKLSFDFFIFYFLIVEFDCFNLRKIIYKIVLS